ncbi:hypothetical protein SAMN06295974_3702 [Plantibacter flavus]|uniref:Uncharacterized protein n=1 Tax=Plantibacter flavus TaxID=150123 RepID=A0A3N2BL01_9MICO|nr:hypothetical protein [Plantibacter flavus]ROR75963.1 hypothetical protein EDD42_3914 [Plantibacter flavus]SMG48246.1 hypothetical protein SAMN06295974_3702 [Plantibacter flavus]
MAKINYKIPSSLDRSFLDHEISLSGGGWQVKPIPVKVLLFWVVSIFAMFWTLSTTFLKNADWWMLLLIGIWWLVATTLLGSYSKTKEMKLSSIPALLSYIAPSARRVVTRKGSDPSNFYSIVGIDGIDESGFITWGDGSVGQAYLTVGAASVLVFDQDRISILNRVDAYYRKVDTTAEYIWVTTKEPQRIYRQQANLELRNRRLATRDPDLFELMEEQHAILRDYVGNSFTSIHQYVIIKADNLEALRRAHSVLRAETDESSLMVKQLTMLDGADCKEMLSTIYTGPR